MRKSYAFLPLALLVISSFTLTSCEKLVDDHLLSYYRFNGNGNDETGYSNATMTNCSYVVDPTFGNHRVLSLNGTGYADLNTGFDYASRSLSMWFKVTSITEIPSHAFVYNYENNRYGAITVGFWKIDGLNKLQLGASNHNLFYPISLNIWYNAVIVTNEMNYNFYINGNLVDSGSYAEYFNSDLGYQYSVVGANRHFLRNMIGCIAETRLYAKALSAEEVEVIYNEDKPFEFPF